MSRNVKDVGMKGVGCVCTHVCGTCVWNIRLTSKAEEK